MTLTREERLDRAIELNEEAGQAIIHGKYLYASRLLTKAASWSPSEEGRKALYARALEAAAMVEQVSG